MSLRSQTMWTRISALPLSDAQGSMIKLARQITRKRIYEYAKRNHIMDFADTSLVEARHRTRRTAIITAGTTLASSIQSAQDMSELEVIFNQISDHI